MALVFGTDDWMKKAVWGASHNNPAKITDSDKVMPILISSYSVDLSPFKSLTMLKTEHVVNVFIDGLSQTPCVESADKKKSLIRRKEGRKSLKEKDIK